MKRTPGGQPGNQNARKHGFYSNVLDATQQHDLEQARNYKGIDGEIDLLRTKIKSVVAHDPENLRLVVQATKTLAKLVITRQKLAEINRFFPKKRAK